MHIRLLVFTLATAGAIVIGPAAQEPQTEAARPKLAVILVVDQMRADYVDRFRDDWTGGLKRLVSDGALFTNAAYPYLTTWTCAGHATVGTGALPHRHGIFQNTWYDRAEARVVPCTRDPDARPVSYGASDGSGHGPARLLLPTFADEMRAQRGSRVAAVSTKARSSIMLAGHGGDAVTWLNDALDGWETSTVYASGPAPAASAFLDENAIADDFGRTWERLLPVERYTLPDDGEGELPPRGWTRLFPHILGGAQGDQEPDDAFYQQWDRSPFADAYVGRFAASLVESLQLGQRDTTDVLLVSFGALDRAGHLFGPDSQEVQDILARLDRTLGMLFERLDALVGAGQWVVGLTADHGVATIPEQARRAGRDAGRLATASLAALVERTAQAAAGPGRYVTTMHYGDVYFERTMYERLSKVPSALKAVMTVLAQQPGIAGVFRRDELVEGEGSSDPLLRAASLSYVPSRAGDLVVAPEAGWVFGNTPANHGTANPYDQRVPLVFMGPGIARGEYSGPATPADLAPTLAALAGISMPNAEGVALRDALSRN